ncbi:MAG TPA: glycosyltransferase, partial [Desulfobacterales bacterium]|nr:glycosyltransferase [Desulfobacterales bacterium]
TREIVKEYAIRYPDKVKVLLQPYNMGPPEFPGKNNFIAAFKACKGEYIAILDGDDYWTSANKLQRQVDFLDNHPDCASCFHWADWLDQESGKMRPGLRKGPPVIKTYYTLDDLLEYGNFIPMASVMFRNKLFGDIPDWYYGVLAGDFVLHMLNAHYGNIGFIDQAMSVFRGHEGGVNTSLDLAKRCRDSLDFYRVVGSRLNLQPRKSYRIGVSKFHSMLSTASWADGHTARALVAGFKAVGIAPLERKLRVGLRIVAAFIPTTYRFLGVLRHSIMVAAEQGPCALLVKAYSKLKKSAFRF